MIHFKVALFADSLPFIYFFKFILNGIVTSKMVF